jgi:erythromycin esterase
VITLTRLLLSILCIAAPRPAQIQATPIEPGSSLEGAIAPPQASVYTALLNEGDTALFSVTQIGIDLVIDVIDPQGTTVDSFDSPTGRNGEETVEIHAIRGGRYAVRLRPYDEREPAGRYRVRFVARRDRAATQTLLENARQWLTSRTMTLPADGVTSTRTELQEFGRSLNAVQVLGLGEATHGSREFGDVRLALTKWLIERLGYRVVALEASVSRFTTLAPYIQGDTPRSTDVTARIETGWIGRRSQSELIDWIRRWNQTHKGDRVEIVGVDAQDHRDARLILGQFLVRAYGDPVIEPWTAAEAELAAADEQTFVFGDSGVDASAKRFLLEASAMLDADAGVLRARYGEQFEAARDAARILLEFADFNSNGEGATINHSRDWYMANRILRSLEGSAATKAVYWAHNSHVAHPKGSISSAGGVLRDVLGCGYAAFALTFGEGAFVAQIPEDRENRLAISSVPPAPPGSLEEMLGRSGQHRKLVTWGCERRDTPEWFNIPRKMHWVGGLYDPGANAREALRPLAVLDDFDGVVYLPKVTAEDVPRDRPPVPARKRSR